ncbi:MAG TPA: TerC family protein [Solirubrobacterales bacterium]|nr:TerC family protein [Solirubrobacterales bacterium]
MNAPTWLWFAFAATVIVLLLLDLFVFHRDAHEIEWREAILFNILWVAVGLGFGLVVLAALDSTRAGEYYAGYVLERALSVDNVFVFAVLFTYFKVPLELHNRVLYWGLVGALALRAIFIILGAELIDNYHFVIYIFGVLLIATGIRMATHDVADVHPEKNIALRALRRLMPVTRDYHGAKLVVREKALEQHERSSRKPLFGRWIATPLMAAVVAIASTDLIFAIDSIPAIFAITTDKFIVYSSNAFALLGMRALYFLLAGAMKRFAYLQAGLAAVLVFVGVKFMLSEVVKIPIGLSLAVIAGTVGAAVGYSLWKTRGEPMDELPD